MDPFFPNFYVVPRALGEYDGVFPSQLSNFPQNRLFFLRVILGHTTHLYKSPFTRQLILFHYFSLTFYWAAHQPQCV